MSSLTFSTKNVMTMCWREFLEHRNGMVTVPLIIAAILLILAIFAAVTAISGFGTVDVDGFSFDSSDFANGMEEWLDQSSATRSKIFAGLLLGVSSPIFAIAFVVTVFQLLGSLFDERSDRSILFWKSMPISDVETVASKYLAAVVMLPLVALAVTVLVQIAVLILMSVVVGFYGFNPWTIVLSNVPFLSVLFSSIIFIFLHALWALPLFAWFMLASAYAPRAPLLFAVVPPVLIIVLEGIITRSGKFALLLGDLVTGYGYGGVIEEQVGESFADGNDITIAPFVDFGRVAEGFFSLQFLIGTIVGVAFLAGAVYLRRARAL
ncbi:MAG: hypothetical protein AAGF15_00100 [Pseudomonadota bacterium]